MPEEVEGTSSVAQGWGVSDGLGNEVFGVADGLDGGVAEDEMAEEGGGKGAAGAVGGGGIEVLSGKPVEIFRGESQKIGGLGLVSGGGHDVEVGVSGGQMLDGGLGLGESFNGLGGEGGELGPVGCDPGDMREELVVEGLDGVRWEQVGAGGRSENRIKNDRGRGGGLIPCRRVPFR